MTSTGISKITKAMAANGSPAPEFETDDGNSYFLMEGNHTPRFWNIIRAKAPASQKARAWLKEFGQLPDRNLGKMRRNRGVKSWGRLVNQCEMVSMGKKAPVSTSRPARENGPSWIPR